MSAKSYLCLYWYISMLPLVDSFIREPQFRSGYFELTYEGKPFTLGMQKHQYNCKNNKTATTATNIKISEYKTFSGICGELMLGHLIPHLSLGNGKFNSFKRTVKSTPK